MSALYGILAEFAEPEPLLEAVRRVRGAGYVRINAYAPFPVEGLSESLGYADDGLAPLTLAGGCLGGLTGFAMQWYANQIDYPLDVGSRPFNSWPAFIPVTFELAVLGAALCAVFGMILANRLPRLHHPVFEVSAFLRASKDRFFLGVQSRDPLFDPQGTAEFLSSLGALAVYEIPSEESSA